MSKVTMVFVDPFAQTRFVLSGTGLLERNGLTGSVALFLMTAYFSFMFMVLTMLLSLMELYVSKESWTGGRSRLLPTTLAPTSELGTGDPATALQHANSLYLRFFGTGPHLISTGRSGYS